MREIISKTLLKLGFSKKTLGYKYLVDLILMGIINENYLPLKYAGYKILAEKYNKSIASIDKNIQNAISNAWTHGDIDEQYLIFGETINDNEGKPSNKQFLVTIISTISDKIS